MRDLAEIEAIARGFYIDFQRLISAEPLGNGHINDTFKIVLETAAGSSTFVLQRVNHQVFKQPFWVTENIVAISNYLSRRGYPLGRLSAVAARPYQNGDWSLRWGGECWRMLGFFDGTITFEKVETETQAFDAAEAFGIFGRCLDGFDVSKLHITIPGFHDGVARMRYFKTVLDRALPERLAEAGAEIDEVLANGPLFEKVAKLGLPLRAVHHDTKINNLLFDENTLRPKVVVDLDTVMPGIVLSDFGDMVRTSTCPADEDEGDLTKITMRPAFYEAVLEGFLSGIGSVLTPIERESLPLAGPWLTLMQAARFLADYLEGDVYYKTKYPAHNFVRAKNQLALFRSMRAQLEGRGF